MIPERYTPITYALFRIVFGFLFFCYGLQKMFGWFGGQVAPLASLQGAAGVIETVCGLLVMVGLFTRPASFLASGEMAVAFSLHPVTIQQLFDIADSGNVMPPKSTWFEPKLRDGLLVHTI